MLSPSETRERLSVSPHACAAGGGGGDQEGNRCAVKLALQIKAGFWYKVSRSEQLPERV